MPRRRAKLVALNEFKTRAEFQAQKRAQRSPRPSSPRPAPAKDASETKLPEPHEVYALERSSGRVNLAAALMSAVEVVLLDHQTAEEEPKVVLTPKPAIAMDAERPQSLLESIAAARFMSPIA